MPRRADPDWFAYVRPGDVLVSPGGSYRVVRWLRRRGTKLTLQFVKVQRSRYPSPCTIRYGHEVRDWRYVGARMKLDTPLDHRIACTIDYTDPALCERVTQDDVVGVVR
jgi:hypothetical protein